MKPKIKLMLVEDNPAYRRGINCATEDNPNMQLISEFATAEIALRSVRDLKPHQMPNLILLDLNLPGMSGLNALPYFIKAIPQAKIIILTQSNKESDVLQAISLGASGYLLKSSTADQIQEAIKTVIEGGAPLDPSVAKFILKNVRSQPPQVSFTNVLSPREIEILTLLAEGFVKKEIAERLCISHYTVVAHVSHIYEKLNATNAPSAVNKAFRLGIFPSRKHEDSEP